jgi:hypothetical protein
MDSTTPERVRLLQGRIDRALRQPVEDAEISRFSEYMPGASVALQDQLQGSAGAGGVTDVEAILDRFEQLRASADAGTLRHALSVVLTHHPAVAHLGLRLPSLEERSPWKVWPGRRDP